MDPRTPTAEELNKFAKLREDFILNRERELNRTLTIMEKELFQAVLEKFISLLINDNGKLTYNGSMVTLNQALDKIFNHFNDTKSLDVIRGLVTDYSKLSRLSANYYSSFFESDKDLTDIKTAIDEQMKNRLGIGTGNKLVKGGFLDSFVSDPYLRNALKTYTYKSVSGGLPYNEFLTGLQTLVAGAPEQDSMLRKHYKTYAFDSYSQFDGSIGNQWRQKLNLKAAMYQGGLIDTSREFCEERNGKIFTIQEMEKWPFAENLPRTKEEKLAGTTIGYIPWIDKGRWNCRHQVNWLSKAVAIKLRPDLKEYFKIIEEIQVRMGLAKQSGPDLIKTADEIAAKNKSKTSGLNLKGESSFYRKVVNEEGGNVLNVKDAVRTTIVADSENINQVIADLEASPIHARTKTQNYQTDALGYSGTIVNVKMSNGILGEIQVNTPSMIYAKESEGNARAVIGNELYDDIFLKTGKVGGQGHLFYEEWRDLMVDPVKNNVRLSEIEKESKAYYSNFR